MKLNVIFSIAAIYLLILGLGFIFFPLAIGRGAVPEDASPALIAYLRVFGITFLGIAVMNWLVRNEKPSTALKAIVVGNVVGFGVGPFLDVWGMLTGARQLAMLFGTIHLLFALAFIWAWRTNLSTKKS